MKRAMKMKLLFLYFVRTARAFALKRLLKHIIRYVADLIGRSSAERQFAQRFCFPPVAQSGDVRFMRRQVISRFTTIVREWAKLRRKEPAVLSRGTHVLFYPPHQVLVFRL